ncbi:MAG: matrixin family metalloprotease [Sandaracinaceae bacterium]
MTARRTLALVLLSGLGMPTPAHAYTTKHTARGDTVRWTQAEVELVLDDSLRRALPRGAAAEALALAAEAWRGFGGPDLVVDDATPSVPYRTGDGHHGVYLLDDWPFQEGLLAVTATTYDESTGRIVDADILVNAAQRFAMARPGEPLDPGVYDLGSVLTHEAGHVLGLGETEDDRMATMWPDIGAGDLHQRTIEEDDAAGILSIYSDVVLAPPMAGCTGARVARGGVGAGSLLWVLAALALLALWNRRRRPGRHPGRVRGVLE